MLLRNKREELHERFRKIQRSWESRWREDFPGARIQMSDSPDIPEQRPVAGWHPAFKIVSQPLCEKDIGSAPYAYLFVNVGGER